MRHLFLLRDSLGVFFLPSTPSVMLFVGFSRRMLPPGKSRLVTSLFSTFDYMRSDNIVETIDSLLKKVSVFNNKS